MHKKNKTKNNNETKELNMYPFCLKIFRTLCKKKNESNKIKSNFEIQSMDFLMAIIKLLRIELRQLFYPY